MIQRGISRLGAILPRVKTVPFMRKCSSQAEKWNYETLAVSSPAPFVAHVELNRPNKRNSMNAKVWSDMAECFSALGKDDDVRAIVISGRGKLFSSGLDMTSVAQENPALFAPMDAARRARQLYDTLWRFQQGFSQIEQCPQPVIAAVHSACIGAGVDLITACDVRFCSKDAYFQVKEVDFGLAADGSTLQRLPKVAANGSFVREICYTAREVYSEEALQHGIVSRVLEERQSCVDAALETAALIAEKSPVAVQTTKESLNYSRDHPVNEGLYHVRLLNQCMLQSEDVLKAAQAVMNKEKPIFNKL